jgi:hypothetical protein
VLQGPPEASARIAGQGLKLHLAYGARGVIPGRQRIIRPNVETVGRQPGGEPHVGDQPVGLRHFPQRRPVRGQFGPVVGGVRREMREIGRHSHVTRVADHVKPEIVAELPDIAGIRVCIGEYV